MPVLICAGLAYLFGVLGLDPVFTRVVQVSLAILGIVLFVVCLLGVTIPPCFQK